MIAIEPNIAFAAVDRATGDSQISSGLSFEAMIGGLGASPLASPYHALPFEDGSLLASSAGKLIGKALAKRPDAADSEPLPVPVPAPTAVAAAALSAGSPPSHPIQADVYTEPRVPAPADRPRRPTAFPAAPCRGVVARVIGPVELPAQAGGEASFKAVRHQSDAQPADHLRSAGPARKPAAAPAPVPVRIDVSEGRQGLHIGIGAPFLDSAALPRLQQRIEEVLSSYERGAAQLVVNGSEMGRIQGSRKGAGHGGQRN